MTKGGQTHLENLCLACSACNAYKGAATSAFDRESNLSVPLFHPRRDRWADHFEFQGAWIVGTSEIGTATVRLLRMNLDEAIATQIPLIYEGVLNQFKSVDSCWPVGRES